MTICSSACTTLYSKENTLELIINIVAKVFTSEKNAMDLIGLTIDS